MDMKQRRKGALVARPCALCGSLVDERDLVMSEVQGLRGELVCSAHPWEREARVRPSFQDRGGVGQVPDLSIDPIWPGSNGGWIDVATSFLPAEDDMAIVAYKASDTTRSSGSTPENDPDLFAGITTAGTYLVRVTFNGDRSGGFEAAFAFGGTTSNAYGRATYVGGGTIESSPLTALNTAVTVSGIADNEIGGVFEMYLVATSSGTINFQWTRNGTGTAVVKNGSYMALTQLA